MNKKKLLLIFLVILFILSFFVRTMPMQEAHWWDETVYLQNAKTIFEGAEGYNELNFRPPLLSILFGIGFFIWDNVLMASIIVGIIGAIGNIYVYFVGKELYNEKIGIISSLIFAFTPFLVSNSRFLLTDIPSLSLIIIFFYYLIKGEKTNNKIFYILSGIIFSLAILMRFTSLILLFIVPLYFIIHQISYKKIISFGIGFSIIILPYFLWAQLTLGFFLKPFISARHMVGDFNEPYLFYFSNFINSFSIIILIGIIIWLISFILNIKINFKINKYELFFTIKTNFNKLLEKNDLILLTWIIFFIGYISYVPHKELRYIIPIALPVILLASKGISQLFLIKKVKIKNLFIGIMILLFIFSSYSSFSRMSEPLINTYQTDEMKISKFISNKYHLNTIYTNHNYPVFAYYTGFKTIKLEYQNELFYSTYKDEMKENGLIIIYNDTNKEPNLNWLLNNSEFNYIDNFNEIFIFEFELE
jgi:4-amino-4-deoxy-L-arabinose transferase-like glycosyltransferase